MVQGAASDANSKLAGNFRLPNIGIRLVEHQELITLAFYKAVFVEFFSTMLFLFFVLGCIFNNCRSDLDLLPGSGNLLDSKPGVCQLTQSRVLSISFSFGVAIFVLVYAAASFSGGHINPAVTIGLMFGKRVSVVRACFYVPAQMAGACVGAGFARAINAEGYHLAAGGANKLSAGTTNAAGWLMEFILTMALVYMVFAATDTARGQDTAHLPVLAPLAIGMVVFLAHLVAIPIDGCSINPARTFGAAVISGNWNNHWLFWIGPLSGGVMAALIYECFYNFDLRAGASQAAVPPPKPADTGAKLPAYSDGAIHDATGAVSFQPFPGQEGLGVVPPDPSGYAHAHEKKHGAVAEP